jgi:two-component system, OmpR family, alkaline phosphatase synthesis response regulator PhoP
MKANHYGTLHQEASNEVPKMSTPDRKRLVSLMEDHEDIARLMAYHLESSGFRIHRPARSYALISDAEKDRPDLFILDLMLPELDGFQLCHSIRAHPNL